MKQTFKIPAGCNEVTIEQIDNQIITTFEPPKSEFKKGDVVFFKDDDDDIFCVMVYDEKKHGRTNPHAYFALIFADRLVEFNDHIAEHWDEMRIATPEEKEMLLTAMHEAGKDFDFEKMEIVDYRWKPERGDQYFYLSFTSTKIIVNEIWDGSDFDKRCFLNGIVFKTEEQAREAANKMLNAIKK